MRKLARSILTMSIIGLAMLIGAPASAALTADQVAKLVAGDGTTGDRFGWSVAVDGDTALIGAPSDESAYVYIRDDFWSWIQQAEFTNDGAFGYSVAVDGDTAVIGARSGKNDKGYATGSAYVFTRSEGIWSEDAKLTASDGEPGDRFGSSIAVDGDMLVIGASFDNNEAGVENTGFYLNNILPG